eukprot:6176631-Pleurochrysis_carterae.AAC.2
MYPSMYSTPRTQTRAARCPAPARYCLLVSDRMRKHVEFKQKGRCMTGAVTCKPEHRKLLRFRCIAVHKAAAKSVWAPPRPRKRAARLGLVGRWLVLPAYAFTDQFIG